MLDTRIHIRRLMVVTHGEFLGVSSSRHGLARLM
jgi:hypothetical protein